MRRILAAAAVITLGSLVSVASPAQAASGPWSVVSAGEQHTCAINTGNSLYCWGLNAAGQVGDGTTELRLSPTRIGAAGAWTSVSAGALHTCAVTTGKSLYCWGAGADGQLGDGTQTNRLSPKKIGTSGVWAAVGAADYHTCAITTGKSLYCWGNNGDGQVGDGTNTGRPSPRKIGSSGAWSSAAGGGLLHTCAISTGSSLYCWGFNGSGQVGDGTTNGHLSPKRIGASGAWALATAGDYHTCAISTAKSLYCWGYNAFGQIGDGTTGTDRLSPKKVGSSGVWARVSAGGTAGGVAQTCGISTGKSLYCWGNNAYGQIGDGTSESPRPTPKRIGSAGVWANVTGGGLHTCGISTGKSLYCWGYNTSGQIGDGSDDQRLSPVRIP